MALSADQLQALRPGDRIQWQDRVHVITAIHQRWPHAVDGLVVSVSMAVEHAPNICTHMPLFFGNVGAMDLLERTAA